MVKANLAIVGCVQYLLGCASGGDPEPTRQVTQAVTSTVASAVLPGYVHSLNASRFKIGMGPSLELNTSQIQRWRGSLGAFAVDPGNGAACALLDAVSPTGPYELDEASHANRVKTYFTRSGLPTDQIGEIQSTYQSIMMGGTTATSTVTPFQLESITSIIRRRAAGVLVVESEAWAKMTTNGDVDMECVFWPSIDISVVNAAASWAKAQGDGPTHAAYLAKLPGRAYRDIGVVIHHTDMSVHAPAQAFASYDVVLDADTSSAARHFDRSGAEFRLPQEQGPTPVGMALRTTH